jgi:hypothetical protein
MRERLLLKANTGTEITVATEPTIVASRVMPPPRRRRISQESTVPPLIRQRRKLKAFARTM